MAIRSKTTNCLQKLPLVDDSEQSSSKSLCTRHQGCVVVDWVLKVEINKCSKYLPSDCRVPTNTKENRGLFVINSDFASCCHASEPGVRCDAHTTLLHIWGSSLPSMGTVNPQAQRDMIGVFSAWIGIPLARTP